MTTLGFDRYLDRAVDEHFGNEPEPDYLDYVETEFGIYKKGDIVGDNVSFAVYGIERLGKVEQAKTEYWFNPDGPDKIIDKYLYIKWEDGIETAKHFELYLIEKTGDIAL